MLPEYSEIREHICWLLAGGRMGLAIHHFKEPLFAKQLAFLKKIYPPPA
jgi:hypothetical protein